MRILDKVVGHQETIERILESYEAGRPGQVYLFVGPSGVGKKQVALGLMQALLCEKNRRACGLCPSCLRVEKSQHEAMMVVEPSGPSIKIEQAREIIERLSFKSMSENRVILIDQAQTLNPQAANSLLKILEEPPERTFFFLTAPTQAALLSTIRSRSRVVSFNPVSEADMARRETAPAWMIKASGGSFEKLHMLQSVPEQETRAKAIELLQLFLNDKDFLTNETWRLVFKERGQPQKYLSYWLSFLRDAMFFINGGKDQMTNLDQVALIQALAQKKVPDLLSLMQKCIAAERALGGNNDPVLVLEKIWVTEKESNYVD